MADVIRFSWGTEYYVDRDFDLNTLRQLTPVKEVGREYIFDSEGEGPTVYIGKKICYEASNLTTAEEEELRKKSKQYETWWKEEQQVTEKLKDKLASITEKIEEEE
jgi:hypothetical protein